MNVIKYLCEYPQSGVIWSMITRFMNEFLKKLKYPQVYTCVRYVCVCVFLLAQAPQRPAHVLNSYLRQRRATGWFLGGDFSSANRGAACTVRGRGTNDTDSFFTKWTVESKKSYNSAVWLTALAPLQIKSAYWTNALHLCRWSEVLSHMMLQSRFSQNPAGDAD